MSNKTQIKKNILRNPKIIGEGNYATVNLYEFNDNRAIKVVGKEIKNNKSKDLSSVLQLEECNKIKCLNTNENPNVIKLYNGETYAELCENTVNSGLPIIFSTYYEKGDLSKIILYKSYFDFIFKNEISSFENWEEIVLYFLEQLVNAVKYIHSRNIAHFDIKELNCFLTKDWNLVLGDFGVSRFFETKNDNEIKLAGPFNSGTFGYIPPEIPYMHSDVYGTKVDIYAIGIVCYQLLSNNYISFKSLGKTFPKEFKDTLFCEIKEIKEKLTMASKEIKNLLNCMCSYKNTDRPSAEKLLYMIKRIRTKSNEYIIDLLNNIYMNSSLTPISGQSTPSFPSTSSGQSTPSFPSTSSLRSINSYESVGSFISDKSFKEERNKRPNEAETKDENDINPLELKKYLKYKRKYLNLKLLLQKK